MPNDEWRTKWRDSPRLSFCSEFRASLREIAIFDLKSGFDSPASASSTLAPIDVPRSNQLPGQLTNDPFRRKDRTAEVDDLG
jgi:hypothetical protein